MAKGIIGFSFTFTALFVDAAGDPFVPVSPTIEVYYFNAVGVRLSLVAPGTVMSVVSGFPNQFAYTITLPTTLTADRQVYATMRGTDPGTGDILVVEEQVDLFDPQVSSGGLRTSFVKAGVC